MCKLVLLVVNSNRNHGDASPKVKLVYLNLVAKLVELLQNAQFIRSYLLSRNNLIFLKICK